MEPTLEHNKGTPSMRASSSLQLHRYNFEKTGRLSLSEALFAIALASAALLAALRAEGLPF